MVRCCVALLLVVTGFADDSKLKAETFKGLAWRSIGPALMSGRIADIAIHPNHENTWYVAAGSGGVWKTENAGTTWTPVFDDQTSYSIGCVAIDPQAPETVWVGSGENVSGRHVGFGDGVYRSQDGGKTWTNMGLKQSEHIGSIRIDPKNSNVVYVAAQGPLWSAGGQRGLFKTTDGGANWTKILGEGEYVGCNEVHLDPFDPAVVYASMHQRMRNVAVVMNGGPGSGIYKSTDGGATWAQLKTGLPEGDMGKIGLALSPIKVGLVYATIEEGARKGGFYRSADGGASWEKRSDYISGGTGPHYYQEIHASPHVVDRIYQMDVWIHISNDGGKTFQKLGETNKHSDNHALAFRKDNPNYLLSGCDGGLYETYDHGATWRFFNNMPITQFYKVAVDNGVPFYNLYGGTQDNNTQGGPNQTDNNIGIRNSDWFITLFGDGHQPAVDPENPDIVYAEWQQGNLVRYDRKNGEIVYVKPQPSPEDPPERWNWDAPILISPHHPARLYYASQRVWRSDNRGDSWVALSSDLSRGQQRLQQPIMGRTWGIDAAWDLYAMSFFGNVTSLSESPVQEGLLYAGTDDGLIQISEDSGTYWRKVDLQSITKAPVFVNDIKADLHDANTVYVAADNHKNGDFRPFLLRSTDRGKTWTSITGNLPERHLVWRVVQDHVNPKLLFAATEFGVFFTLDQKNWIELTGGMPTISVRDLALQKRENDLVAATFGRSFYVLDDISPLRQATAEQLNNEATLFDVPDAYWYIQRRPLAMQPKAYQGDGFFRADNPPFGAVFTYYLSEGYQSARKQRQEAEKKGKASIGPFERYHEEEQEGEPAVILTVKDESGQIVRHLSGSAEAGYHRVAWDLRYPKLDAWKPQAGDDDYFLGNQGWLAAPGTYTVEMSKRVKGVTTLISSCSFHVVPLPGYEHNLPASDPVQVTRFYRQIEQLQRTSTALAERLKETRTRVGAIEEALMRSTAAVEVMDRILDIKSNLYNLEDRMNGDRIVARLGEPGKPSLNDRIFAISLGNLFSTKGPTPNHLQNYEWAVHGISDVSQMLDDLIGQQLEPLEDELNQLGVPWTPGRDVQPPK